MLSVSPAVFIRSGSRIFQVIAVLRTGHAVYRSRRCRESVDRSIGGMVESRETGRSEPERFVRKPSDVVVLTGGVQVVGG